MKKIVKLDMIAESTKNVESSLFRIIRKVEGYGKKKYLMFDDSFLIEY